MSWALVLEAVTSTALSHDEDCGCLVCRAASGEPGALAEVMASLPLSPPPEENTREGL